MVPGSLSLHPVTCAWSNGHTRHGCAQDQGLIIRLTRRGIGGRLFSFVLTLKTPVWPSDDKSPNRTLLQNYGFRNVYVFTVRNGVQPRI